MAGRPAGKGAVDIRTFLSKIVEAHKAGQNQSWVAEELGVTPAAVSLRMKSLRDKGVNLPTLVSSRSGNTTEDANDILREIMGDTEGDNGDDSGDE
jgi:predicted transcriptional regulator